MSGKLWISDHFVTCSDACQRRGRLEIGAFALGALLILAQSLPTWRSSLTEGFQYNALAIAISLADGRTVMTDQMDPVSQQFFLLSRLGSNLLLASTAWLIERDPLLPSRIIALISLAVFLAASLTILKRLTPLRLGWRLLIVSLGQAAFLASYYATDSLTAGAATATAIAIFAGGTGWARVVLSALFLGSAISLRLDSLLVAAFFALALMLQPTPWSERVPKLLVAATIAGSIPNLLQWWFGSSVLEALALSREMVERWDRPFVAVNVLSKLMVVVQPALALLAAVGIWALLARRDWKLLATLALPILLYMAIVAPQFYNSRQLLPLLPVLFLIGALGLLHCLELWRTPTWRAKVPGLGFATLLALAFAYPVGRTEEGLRPIIGQVPASFVWWRYLDTVNSHINTTIQTVEAYSRATPTAVVLSDKWDSDRLVHLAALKAGYAPQKRNLRDRCQNHVEVFRSGERAFYHFRLGIVSRDPGRLLREQLLSCLPKGADAPGQALLVATRSAGDLRGLPGLPVAYDPKAERPVDFLDLKLRLARPTIGMEVGFLPKVWRLPLDGALLGRLPPCQSLTARVMIHPGNC